MSRPTAWLLVLLSAGCQTAARGGSDATRPRPDDDVRLVRPAAPAGPVARDEDDDRDAEWRFALSGYAWLASKNGVLESGGTPIVLDDPSESTGLFLYAEGESPDRWGFVADLDLLHSTDRANGGAGVIEIEDDTLIGELDATFRPAPDSTLQLLAGVRVLDDTTDIRFPLLPDARSDTTQIDPVVGLQGTWELGSGVRVRLRGDVGGFGADSDFTYQGLGLLAWEFAGHWNLTAGYRLLGWEYEVSGNRVDLRLDGPVLGLAVRF